MARNRRYFSELLPARIPKGDNRKSERWLPTVSPIGLFSTIIGLKAATELMPIVLANVDELFNWPLNVTYRVLGLCLVGIPLSAISVLSFRELLLREHKDFPLPKMLLFGFAPIAPSVLFSMTAGYRNWEAFIISLSLILMVASFGVAIAPLRRRQKDRFTSKEPGMPLQLLYLTIASSISMFYLALCYPWLGVSSSNILILGLAFLPAVAYLTVATFELIRSSRSGNLKGVFFSLFPTTFLFFHPTITIHWGVVLGLILLFLAVCIGIHFLIKRWKDLFEGSLVVILGMLVVLTVFGSVFHTIGIGRVHLTTKLNSKDFLEYLRRMDEPVDEVYHGFLKPEQERSEDFIARVEQINLVAKQNFSMHHPQKVNKPKLDEPPIKLVDKGESDSLHKGSECMSADPFVEEQIELMIDSAIYLVRSVAIERCIWVYGYYHDLGVDTPKSNPYENYRSNEAKRAKDEYIRDSCENEAVAVREILRKHNVIIQERDLVLYSLLRPFQQMEYLHDLMKLPRQSSVKKWEMNYRAFLEQYESSRYDLPAARARRKYGPQIVGQTRSLVIFHGLTLFAISLLAVYFFDKDFDKKDRGHLWRGFTFVCAIVVIMLLTSFDFGFDRMLDIRSAKLDKSSGFLFGTSTDVDTKEVKYEPYDDTYFEEEMLKKLDSLLKKPCGGSSSGDTNDELRDYFQKKENELWN